MQISEFDFEIPSTSIATEPLKERASAKMMVVNRTSGKLMHQRFMDLPNFLNEGDLVVINETRVIPARFKAERSTGAELEGLLLPSLDKKIRVWLKGKANPGDRIKIHGWVEAEVLSRNEREVELSGDLESLLRALQTSGEIPIPPYIINERKRRNEDTKRFDDLEDYQSIFAESQNGFSSAAPTASLHFDEFLINNLREKKIEFAFVTLHVGASTFMPIESSDINEHKLPYEIVSVSENTISKIEAAKARGSRVVALGTTVARSLESAARRIDSGLSTEFYETDLFIKPPFKFKYIDSLITNFHWGRSSLLVLVGTFCEPDQNPLKGFWKCVYDTALIENYRFYSFGDGMLIL